MESKRFVRCGRNRNGTRNILNLDLFQDARAIRPLTSRGSKGHEYDHQWNPAFHAANCAPVSTQKQSSCTFDFRMSKPGDFAQVPRVARSFCAIGIFQQLQAISLLTCSDRKRFSSSAGEPCPADFLQIRRVARIFSKEPLFDYAPNH